MNSSEAVNLADLVNPNMDAGRNVLVFETQKISIPINKLVILKLCKLRNMHNIEIANSLLI